jgi:hypothetical protein
MKEDNMNKKNILGAMARIKAKSIFANEGEEEKETTWNLCKQYDAENRRRDKVILTNFVSRKLEKKFGDEIENLFRFDWQSEVEIFCKKYGYE